MIQTMRVIQVPEWVPEEARRYLEHTENGRSIRQLARRAGCHPSTVLRQVRRMETLRDDPLIDSALDGLTEQYFKEDIRHSMPRPQRASQDTAGQAKVTKALIWLNHGNAILAYAEGMDKAVIVRDDQDEKKISIDKGLAGEIALRGWVQCVSHKRLSRYQLSDDGRAALSSMVAAQENRARVRRDVGFAEAARSFQGKEVVNSGGARRVRYGSGETPLAMLARLADRNGEPFLTVDLVRAGERLREDYELAQIAEHIYPVNTVFDVPCAAKPAHGKTHADTAGQRAHEALAALGPGLCDIALRCCCHLEGLETAEKQLGWSARSGKVVLRIALQQLKSHYDALADQKELIG